MNAANSSLSGGGGVDVYPQRDAIKATLETIKLHRCDFDEAFGLSEGQRSLR
ncbi:hypothetical protein [Treponema sp.]|uniref:hypothetical protein n=1 Tax=Treponema sp. TaxID=166 RepID=UPI00388DF934